MDIGTPLSRLGANVTMYLKEAYPRLFWDTALLLAAIVAVTVGLCVLIRERRKTQPVWTFRGTTPLALHYTVMALLWIPVLYQLLFCGQPIGWVLFAASAVFAALAVYGLLKWRRMGLAFAICAVWFGLLGKEASDVLAVVRDFREIAEYSTPGKIGVFAAARYLLGSTAALAALAATATVLLVAYYSKRRYLFVDGCGTQLLRAEDCPRCGAPFVRDGDFCSACGAHVPGHPHSVLRYGVLDKVKYCTACGAEADKLFGQKCDRCPRRKPENPLSKLTQLCPLLIALLLLAPSVFGNPSGYLTKGSAAANNAYVASVQEWRADPSVAKDGAWLARFEAEEQALFDVNGRVFLVLPQRLNYSGLRFYVQYLDASYKQMAVMQLASETIRSGDVDGTNALMRSFDRTIDMQTRAFQSAFSLLLGQDVLRAVYYMAVDGVRFYGSLLPAALLYGLLFAAAAAAFAVSLILRRKTADAAPFDRIAERAEEDEVYRARADARKKAGRKDRILSAAVALATVLAIFGSAFLTALPSAPAAHSYETGVNSAVWNGLPLLIWLSQCETDPNDALEQRQSALGLVSGMEETASFLAAESSEKNSPEEEPVRVAAAALSEPLREVRAALEDGRLPETETVKTASRLLAALIRLSASVEAEAALEDLADDS